tara:strand:- start:1309 stop:1461 length:153 start_codon:yes stop_codon:yes gene_type:complete
MPPKRKSSAGKSGAVAPAAKKARGWSPDGVVLIDDAVAFTLDIERWYVEW